MKHQRFKIMSGVVVLSAVFSITGFALVKAHADLAPQQPVLNILQYWVLGRFAPDEHKLIQLAPSADTQLKAKTNKDECYAGIGVPYPPIANGSCPTGAVPKANQSYLWGLTQVEQRELWLGTYSNGICVVANRLGNAAQEHPGYYVCEADQAASGAGDFRPPRVYQYSISSGALIDKSPKSGAALALLSDTLGLRSAGNLDGVVFLAGPNLAGTAVNFFAYDADTGRFLGAKAFPEYNDIRSWLAVGDGLYAGVGVTNVSSPTDPGGVVLRWRGKKSTNPNKLFRFEIVGKLDTAAGNLALHRGRLYVNSWPNFSGGIPDLNQIRYPGLYEGPSLRMGGLTGDDADSWKKVWSITDYERDPIAALMTFGGALASHNGVLYWGTISGLFGGGALALQSHQAGLINLDANSNGQLDIDETLATILGAHRPTMLFRGFGGERSEGVELVYGEKYLPFYDPSKRSYDIAYDDAHLNKLGGRTPLWGAAGYGNFFNAYTWSMSEHFGNLYLGTFDATQLIRAMLPSFALSRAAVRDDASRRYAEQRIDEVLKELTESNPFGEGADLLRIDGSNDSVIAETFTGLGNSTNYGFRTMVETDEGLFIGTANAMNLHPDGGWELIQLR